MSLSLPAIEGLAITSSSKLAFDLSTIITQSIYQNIDKTTGLESLAPELRLAILKRQPDIQTLQSLLRASPSCYRTFQHYKRPVLKSVLQHEISPSLLLEAKSVLRARLVPRKADQRICLISVKVFLKKWRTEREFHQAHVAAGKICECGIIDEVDAIEITNMWLNIQALSRELSSDMPLPPVRGGEISTMNDNGEDGVSDTERNRIVRAMYRIEVFLALFRETPLRSPWLREVILRSQERDDNFFRDSGIRSWEASEFLCVFDWYYWTYWGILNGLEEEIVKHEVEIEKATRKTFAKPLEGDEYNTMERMVSSTKISREPDWQKEQCNLLRIFGAEPLVTILKARSGKEKLKFLKEHLGPRLVGPELVLDGMTERQRHGVPVYVRRREQEFSGDSESGPNIGWVMTSNVANENRFNQHRWLDREYSRWGHWGYCLWDKERFNGWTSQDWRGNWGYGNSWRKGRWECILMMRSSGRVVPDWIWTDLESIGEGSRAVAA